MSEAVEPTAGRPRSGRYRKVEVRTWGDEKFRALSPIPPCGQGLWLFLITGPHTSPIPGLFKAGRASMAEDLGWELEDFDEAFGEAFDQGMVKADFRARLVWVPKAIQHNRPESPNVVLSWGAEFDLLPECDLKRQAYESLRASIHALGEPFGKAFDKAFAKPSVKATAKTMVNQEQEQKQEQKQEQRDFPAAAPVGAAPAPTKDRAKSKTTPSAEPTAGAVAFDAYAMAYANRYGVKPIRNAKVNGQFAQLAKQLPDGEAGPVAAFFVGHKNALYVNAGHAPELLLRDCAKLRTQWVTGHALTQTEAQQADRTQTNANAFGALIAEAQQRDQQEHAA